jgi:hypothetical protein
VKARLGRVEGCSDKELTDLQTSQGVTCLPNAYIQLMRVIGKQGLDNFLDGSATCQQLLQYKVKPMLLDDLTASGLAYSEDIFVFFEHDGYLFYCFRTKDGTADPAVYMYRGDDCFYKWADTFSEFIYDELEGDKSKGKALAHKRISSPYVYDPVLDEFKPAPPPIYEEPLSVEAIIELIKAQYGSELAGCSDKEMELLLQTQGVSCLPETYSAFMRLMGKNGINAVLRYEGKGDFEHLKTAQAILTSRLREEDKQYPEDIFVFCIEDSRDFCFFRTYECPHDPPVFSYQSDWYTHEILKAADSITQFFRYALDPNTEYMMQRTKRRLQVRYLYDPESDTFGPQPRSVVLP